MPEIQTRNFYVGDIVRVGENRDHVPLGFYEVTTINDMSFTGRQIDTTLEFWIKKVDVISVINGRLVLDEIVDNEEMDDCCDCGDNMVISDLYNNCYDDNLRCASCNSDYVNEQENDNSDIGSVPCRDYEDNKIISTRLSNKQTRIMQSMRGFGVEIEGYGKSYGHIKDIASEIDYRIGISGDGSLNNSRGFELQFPLINGRQAEAMVEDCCKTLKEKLTRVDSSCGYHVHLQCLPNESSFVFIQRVMLLAVIFDDVIMSFLPYSRRQNRYCQTVRNYIKIDQLLQAKNKQELELLWYKDYNKINIRNRKQGKYDNSRYYGFNFHCYLSKMKHLEVRHHSGTINADKILHWANLHTLLLDFAHKSVDMSEEKQNSLTKELLNLYDINLESKELDEKTDVLFNLIKLSPEGRDYFRKRQNRFRVYPRSGENN